MSIKLADWIKQQAENGRLLKDLRSIEAYQEYCNVSGSDTKYSSYERRLRSLANVDRIFDGVNDGYKDINILNPKKPTLDQEQFEDILTDNARILHIRSANIRTPEDLLDFAGIDKELWKISEQTANSWGGANSGMYQVKVKLKPIQPDDLTEDDYKKIFESMVDEFSGKFKPKFDLPKWKFKKFGSKNALEIALVDHHFDSHSFKDNRTVEERIAGYIATVREMVRKAKPYNIEQIFFVVGHDFFNTDSVEMTTTKGTKQHDIVGYKQGFKAGLRCILSTVHELLKTAPVEVIMVPGNHDTQRAFYLGCAVSAYFSKHKHVRVNNGDRDLKFFNWGKVFVGLTHKEARRNMNLPLVLSRKFKEIWAKVEFIEIHKGHLHKEKVKEVITIDEETTIKVRNLPSLSYSGEWEDYMGFMHTRVTQGFVWNNETGLDAILHVSPKSVDATKVQIPQADYYGQEENYSI